MVLAATLGLAACSSNSAPLSAPPAPTVGIEHAAATPPDVAAAVTAQPANGTGDASPKGPIQLSVANGTIATIQLSNPDGKAVAGKLSDDKRTWTASEALGYNKAYTWSGSATGTNGQQVAITGTFTTVKPRRSEGGHLNVGDNQTYGIAMPIALTFDNKVTDKASVEKSLSVETSVPTPGSWAWLDDQTVHWRPQEYWKPNTTVTVNAKLYGTAFGNGVYGKQDISSHFTIGRDQRVAANTQTHRFVVSQNGVVTNDFPASYGLDSDPGRTTKSGIHVVMSKSATYSMSNPAYHYENVEVPWAVRLSNNGEFAHGLAASIPSQGKRNVSHGCANLSPANAKIYYDSVLTGDPVEIVGTNQQLSAKDGDYYDWAIAWDQWQAKSAIR
jgi:lipoprotein-anchoring transpeptidase ErfK/SrfK